MLEAHSSHGEELHYDHQKDDDEYDHLDNLGEQWIGTEALGHPPCYESDGDDYDYWDESMHS